MMLKTLCLNQDDYKKAADTIMDTYNKMLEDKLEGIGEYYEKDETEENIKKLKGLFRDSIRSMEQDQGKVVIIIDELDRCKPTFAVQLLEIVKHLFNVKGIVFIFALDINQLQHCVKTVYGEEFDAIGYLERFFDYYSLLPKGSDENLFHKLAQEYEILDNDDDYYKMCSHFNLTPREMKGVCSSFYYLNKYQLKDYPAKARQMYFYLLVLKHCHPERIHALLGENMQAAREEFFGQYMPRCLETTRVDRQPFFTAVVENKTIKETIFLYMHESENGEKHETRQYDFNAPIEEKEKGSLSYIIYPQDYKKDIGNMHVLEYLFTRIEAYGSAIPMEVKKEKIKRGKRLAFGRWHRDNEKDMEPIEWIVLERQGDMALLVTKYAIDCLPYNREYVGTTWEECDLRKWLNGEFYREAFSDGERKKIAVYNAPKPINPQYGTDPGNPTNDRIFLLSMQEAGKYFENDQKRVCKPTEHARKKLIEGYKGFLEGFDPKREKPFISLDKFIEIVESSCAWWLRSPGVDSNRAADVYTAGSVYAYGDSVDDASVAVRPALWLILNP